MRSISICVGIFFILIALDLKAQDHPILKYFRGEAFSGQIVLTWNISGGNNCNGITIFHSSDSINYTEIGGIPGICGALDDDEPYRFTDENPTPNKRNYYKLKLGNQGFTTPLSVFYYETQESGFVFFPNPTNDDISVFVNGYYQNSSVVIYDASGKKILEKSVVSGSLVPISLSQFEAGNYIIQLLDGSTLIGSEKVILID